MMVVFEGFFSCFSVCKPSIHLFSITASPALWVVGVLDQLVERKGAMVQNNCAYCENTLAAPCFISAFI